MNWFSNVFRWSPSPKTLLAALKSPEKIGSVWEMLDANPSLVPLFLKTVKNWSRADLELGYLAQEASGIADRLDAHKMAVPELAEAWADVVGSELMGVHRKAFDVMALLGERAFPWLLPKLKDPDWRVRRGAIAGITAIWHKNRDELGPLAYAVAPVGELLNDEHSFVRGSAAMALVEAGSAAKVATPLLTKLLNDSGNKDDAARALHAIRCNYSWTKAAPGSKCPQCGTVLR